MADIAQYLEAAKVEEISEQLKSEGYQVLSNRIEPDTKFHYDIVAVKGDKRIAVEVKARSHLRESAGIIRELRENATRQGYDEFRLVIVNPPRERIIEIENFDNILYNYIVNASFADIEELAGRVSVEDVSDIEIDSIEVSADNIDVHGTGIVSVSLEYGGGDSNDGLSIDHDFPFTFTTTLSHDMTIDDSKIDIDTSSFFE